jgi:hypothetical protein
MGKGFRVHSMKKSGKKKNEIKKKRSAGPDNAADNPEIGCHSCARCWEHY